MKFRILLNVFALFCWRRHILVLWSFNIAFLVGLVPMILDMELCSEMCFALEVGLDVVPYPWFLLSVDMKTLTEPDTVIRYLVNCFVRSNVLAVHSLILMVFDALQHSLMRTQAKKLRMTTRKLLSFWNCFEQISSLTNAKESVRFL